MTEYKPATRADMVTGTFLWFQTVIAGIPVWLMVEFLSKGRTHCEIRFMLSDNTCIWVAPETLHTRVLS